MLSSPCQQETVLVTPESRPETRIMTPAEDHTLSLGLNSRPPESAPPHYPREVFTSTVPTATPQDYATLREDNARLQAENAALREEYSKVQDDLRGVVLDNEELQANCKTVQSKLTDMDEKLEATRIQVTTLADEVSKLIRKSNSSKEEHPPPGGPSKDVPPTTGSKPLRHVKPRRRRLPLRQPGLGITNHLIEQDYNVVGKGGKINVRLCQTNVRTVEIFSSPAIVRRPPPWFCPSGWPPPFPFGW